MDSSATAEACPNLWQLSLGVLRMWHRILFRSETIGLSKTYGVRGGWRAFLFQSRLIRFPFLLWERSVVPLDLTGLASTPEQIGCHLLGTHHEGAQFVYDLEILSAYPGEMERLEILTEEVVNTDSRRSRWLRDLVVYEGYHEDLLKEIKRWRSGRCPLSDEQKKDADISFCGFLSWCRQQPATPTETWRKWRSGSYTVGCGVNVSSQESVL